MSLINLLGLGRPSRKHKRKGKGLRGAAASECRDHKGKIKKGWRLGKGGRCIRAKGK